MSGRDLPEVEQAAAAVPAARPWRIDVLVNNAGIQRDGTESIAAMPFSIFERQPIPW